MYILHNTYIYILPCRGPHETPKPRRLGRNRTMGVAAWPVHGLQGATLQHGHRLVVPGNGRWARPGGTGTV